MRAARLFLALAAVLAAAPLVPSAAAARPVTSQDARTAAAAFLARLDPSATLTWQEPLAAPGRTVGWVCGVVPAGYLVLAGDTDLPPVVAYARDAACPREEIAASPLGRLAAADLASRLAATPSVAPATVAAHHAAWDDLADGVAAPRGERFEQWPPEGSTPTGGWLLTSWTQNAPYNADCPLDLAHGGARSLAGCPAVAIAMILDHQRLVWAGFGPDDRYWHAYAGNNYWIPDAHAQYDFPDFPELNAALAVVEDHWSDGAPLTNADKAALVFAAGVAATQVYAAAGSGTFGVDQAYEAYGRLGFAFTAQLLGPDDPDLYDVLAEDMRRARPAHLAVVDPGWTMGHNLVVDGWNTDGYFHLNFGWGGPYNGWYLLPAEIPYGLTVIEGVIVHLVPESVDVADHAPAAPACTLACSPNPFNPRTVLTVTAPEAGWARLAVYDLAGRLVEELFAGDVEAGPRALTWSPRDLASGVYLARLEMAGQAATARLVLLR